MPQLLTFDIFGTVLDWRRGMALALGRPLLAGEFDALVDHQGLAEQRAFQSYRAITAQSLREISGVNAERANAIGESVGRWPLFEDSADALAELQRLAPCAATTNSDRMHRAQIEAQLRRPLDGWICAEDVGVYKPNPGIWHAASRTMAVPFSRDWWHVSAYADYDLATARALGLTCVLVNRPHARAGAAHAVVNDLAELAARVTRENC